MACAVGTMDERFKIGRTDAEAGLLLVAIEGFDILKSTTSCIRKAFFPGRSMLRGRWLAEFEFIGLIRERLALGLRCGSNIGTRRAGRLVFPWASTTCNLSSEYSTETSSSTLYGNTAISQSLIWVTHQRSIVQQTQVLLAQGRQGSGPPSQRPILYTMHSCSDFPNARSAT